MREQQDKKAAAPTERAGNKLAPADAPQTSENTQFMEVKIEPEISVYISDPSISPSAFIKVIKTEGVKRFRKGDEERAHTALNADPSGERLWALMSQANLPEAIDRWIWPAAQAQLGAVISDNIISDDRSTVEILQRLQKSLSHSLWSKDKDERKSAENWLRIGICWLLEKRSIDVWTLSEIISNVFFEDSQKARSAVKRAVAKGSTKELRLSVANVRLGNALVANARLELAEERQVANNLRVRLAEQEKKAASLEAEIAALRVELAEKENELQDVRTQFENERHHWGHDLSETKAGQRVLLGDRLTPLISDAIDALEIEPPAPSAALKRIKAVLRVIEEANS